MLKVKIGQFVALESKMGNTLHNKIYLGRSLFSSRRAQVALAVAACVAVGLAVAAAGGMG